MFFLSIGGMFGRFGRHAIEARTSGFVWSNPRVVDTKPTDMSRSSNVKHGLEKLCLSSDRLFLTDRKMCNLVNAINKIGIKETICWGGWGYMVQTPLVVTKSD